MTNTQLQNECEKGQQLLAQTEYLAAESILANAEAEAWQQQDWDTLSRLYMPLQEARRQRRQRCGEGVVRLDLIAQGPADEVDSRRIIENYPHGQLLVAGWGSIEPAVGVRQLQSELGLYVETFLAAVYPVGNARVVVIVPTADVRLPDLRPTNIDELLRKLPPHCLVYPESDLPKDSRKGDAQTFSEVMSLWEKLHGPFLAAADNSTDPIQKMQGYRKTIEVDYACELAHQRLSDVARTLDRAKK